MFELHPKTKKLLELFASAPYGAAFTYGEILHETECDLMGADRQRIYTVLRRLERDHQKTLINQRGIGYRIAEPSEHVGSMMVRKGRAGRQIQLADRTGTATNLDLLNPGQVQTWADATAWISRASQVLAHHDRRIERLEARMNRVDPEGVETPPVDGSAEEIEGS